MRWLPGRQPDGQRALTPDRLLTSTQETNLRGEAAVHRRRRPRVRGQCGTVTVAWRTVVLPLASVTE